MLSKLRQTSQAAFAASSFSSCLILPNFLGLWLWYWYEQNIPSVLTYINQLHVKDQDLTPQQVVDFCDNFPGHWEVEFCQIQTPSSFIPTSSQPTWAPSWWDAAEFGPWHDCTLVRLHVPPTMKSAANKSNWHYVVIGRRRPNIVKTLAKFGWHLYL